MKYAVTFFLLAAGWAALAVTRGGWHWVLLWPALSFAVVGWAYATARPGLLGKRADGSIAPAAFVLLLPYFALTWVTWHAVRALSPGGAAHEVAPGVFVGRRPAPRDLPPGTRLVVDLTGEFAARRGVRAGDGRSYLCVPTLDGSVPPDRALSDLIERMSACGCEGGGGVYIHCAQGRGRSAAVAAALLIARGVAADVEDAERIMKAARPLVRLNGTQRAWVSRVTRGGRRPAL